MSSYLSLPEVLRNPIHRGAGVVRSTVGGLTWGPAVGVARAAIISVLSQIETGTLLLVDGPGESRHVFGQKLSGAAGTKTTESGLPRRADTVPRVEIVVKNEAFWVRLFLFADMGFAEAYMLGDFECEDLTSFFQVSLRSQDIPVSIEH